MNGAHRLQRCLAALIAPSIGIDMIPILGRVVERPGETIVERLIKCLDRGSDGSFPVVTQGSKLRDKNQPDEGYCDRLQGQPPFVSANYP
jgi:hypothetical protein